MNIFEEIAVKVRNAIDCSDAARIIEDFVTEREEESWKQGYDAGNDTTDIEEA